MKIGDCLRTEDYRAATNESWSSDGEATRSRPISLAETRGNGYVVSDRHAPEDSIGVGDGGGAGGGTCPSPPKKKIGTNYFRAVIM